MNHKRIQIRENPNSGIVYALYTIKTDVDVTVLGCSQFLVISSQSDGTENAWKILHTLMQSKSGIINSNHERNISTFVWHLFIFKDHPSQE